MYVYKTTNLITEKIYIGKRVYREKDDNWYLGSGIYLKRSIKKYGRENFIKEIIEWCDNKNILNEREIYWINHFNSRCSKIGYNLSKGGEGGNVGEEAYIKISNKLKGIKKSKEVCNKISEALKDKPKSEEHKEKIRQTLIGTTRPQEVVEKMSKSIKEKYDNGWESPVQKTVYQYNKFTGEFIEEFKSATEASKILGIDRKAINNNCLNKTKSSGGFIWSRIKKENIKNEYK